MWSFQIKRYLPRGLYGRAALILMVPIVALQLVVSVVFIQRHYDNVTRQLTSNLAVDLRLILTTIETAPDLEAARQVVTPLAAALSFQIELPSPMQINDDQVGLIDLSSSALITTIRARIKQDLLVDLRSDSGRVILYIGTRHGTARISTPRSRASPGNPHQFLVITIFFAIVMGMIGFFFLRNQVRPIRKLAQAAEAFGKGQRVDYAPSGATEVRSAGAAFLAMRGRIERHIEQRTMMLSGVSHDLRTPLTRMRLALSLQEDNSETNALMRDVDEMERLLDEFLEFARGESAEAMGEVDLAALAEHIVTRMAATGAKVSLGECVAKAIVTGREVGLMRAIENLVGNAVQYGDNARVSVRLAEETALVIVEDDGPGIAPEYRQQALRPFARLDKARNQNRGGGVGLGLAITRDIVRRHGGRLVLDESRDLGGLSATISLPI